MKKIVGIFVIMLLITTAFTAVGTMNNKTVVLTQSLKTKSTSTDIVWSDNFDSYTLGQYLDGTPDDGGWKSWADNPSDGAYIRNNQSLSSPHSVEIAHNADILHEFSGIYAGDWTFTSWVYVPTEYNSFSSSMVFLSYYKASPQNPWLCYPQFKISFDGMSGHVKGYGEDKKLPLIRDQWIQIRLEMDLQSDWLECYYNDELLVEQNWTYGYWHDEHDYGFLNFAGVDLCWGGSPVYHDDLSLEGEVTGPIPNLDGEGSLSWTNVEPGSTIGGSFTLENIGEPTSRLEWIIDEYPEWGRDWTFQPEEGMLTPEDDPMTVEVSFKAPDKKSTGVIKVCAIGDPDDYYEIPVSVIVKSRNKAINNPFLQFLQNHLNLFPILQKILDFIL